VTGSVSQPSASSGPLDGNRSSKTLVT
jgi:hypothetical protein